MNNSANLDREYFNVKFIVTYLFGDAIHSCSKESKVKVVLSLEAS